jgi:GT2 family glycosyltransferase
VTDPKALIITVNFRQDQCTLQLLRSAMELDGFSRCHLLIVDNNSDDGSVSSIRRASSGLSNVELLASPRNGGYFGAASWAMRRYGRNQRGPDWVLVCNNDIVFEDKQFLLRLFQRDPAEAGVIAPAITSSHTGHDENPSIRHRPSRFRMWRYQFWLSHYYMTWFQQWLSPYVRRARSHVNQWSSFAGRNLSNLIYAPNGAFLIFSRKFFEAGGFIDDGSFLYAEEFRVAEMCRLLGLPVIHDPELRVWHQGSQSTGRMLSRSTYLHQKNGFEYALARYKNSYPELRPLTSTSTAARKSTVDPRSLAAGGDSIR